MDKAILWINLCPVGNQSDSLTLILWIGIYLVNRAIKCLNNRRAYAAIIWVWCATNSSLCITGLCSSRALWTLVPNFVIGRLGNLIFFILKQLHEKFLKFDRLRTVVFQLNLKYLCENYKPFAGSSIKKIIAWFVRDICHKCHPWYFKIVSNFTCLTAREITYKNFEISLLVFMPNITTNHAITYTNHMLGTLDFTGSEHWAPFNFP